MAKKLTAVIICLLIAVSFCVNAETTPTDDAAAIQETPTQDALEAQQPDSAPPGGKMGRGMGGPPPGGGSFGPSQMPPRPDEPARSENTPAASQDAQTPDMPQQADTASDADALTEDAAQPDGFENPRAMGGGMPMENTATPSNEQSTSSVKDFLQTYETPVISVIILALAFIFVIFYKRKNY